MIKLLSKLRIQIIFVSIISMFIFSPAQCLTAWNWIWPLPGYGDFLWGIDGKIFLGMNQYYDGDKWTKLPGYHNISSLQALWGTSFDNVYGVYNDICYHFNGTQWSLHSQLDRPNFCFMDIWGSGPNNIYAVGYESGNGYIFHFNGKEWAEGFKKIDLEFYGIWGASENDIWAIGIGVGGIIHFDGTDWNIINELEYNFLTDI